jgi:hypothetical protein
MSITSFSSAKSKGSLTAAWAQSRRSSSDFGMVTGFGQDSFMQIGDGDSDGSEIFSVRFQDTIVVDV